MREHGGRDLFFSGFHGHGNNKALNHFRHFGTQHMHAENTAGLCIKNSFYKAIGALT